MPRYVALVRGVNVGGKNKLPMAQLRELLGMLGYTEARTHLNSGNAVFTSAEAEPAALAQQIERALADTIDRPVRCLVRSGAELLEVIDANPLRAQSSDGSKTMAHFLSAQPDPALLAEHDPCALDPDTIFLGERVIYQWCPDGLLQAPPVGTFAERHLDVAVTTRNWNTVTKLATLLEA